MQSAWPYRACPARRRPAAHVPSLAVHTALRVQLFFLALAFLRRLSLRDPADRYLQHLKALEDRRIRILPDPSASVEAAATAAPRVVACAGARTFGIQRRPTAGDLDSRQCSHADDA